jgi:metallo-beta-lactamase family protein
LDHSGCIPLLVKGGFRGKIYCTPPTRDLAKIILEDSAKLQEEDAEYANRLGFSKHAPAKPLYTVSEAHASLSRFETIADSTWHPLFEEMKFRFTPSGHILGSAFIEIDHKGTRFVFSGDLGRTNPLLLNPPTLIERADILVVESTYGDRIHEQQTVLKRMETIVHETLMRKGHLLIPSFAVGRTQDVIYILSQLRKEKKIPSDVPIYLDSPMGVDATDIFLTYPQWHRLPSTEAAALGKTATMVRSQQQSEELLHRKTSTIVIAGSGMISGGRILHHLFKRLPDDRNTVLIVGFQAAGTRGRLLREGIPELKIHGQYVPVKARIEEITTLSAHADQAEILAWLRGFKHPPQKTFIVHGEPQASDALRVRIKDTLGWETLIPQMTESFPVAL